MHLIRDNELSESFLADQHDPEVVLGEACDRLAERPSPASALNSLENFRRLRLDFAVMDTPIWPHQAQAGVRQTGSTSIMDVFEGTEQIQQLVISRAISGLRIE